MSLRGCVLLAALLLSSGNAVAQTSQSLRILFVGNSLTYYNDVPRIVEAIVSAARPGEAVHVDMLVGGGASIADHLQQAELTKLLKAHAYDVVVLQDLGGFPDCESSFPGCKRAVASVCEATQRIRDAHVRPVLFGTWQGSAADQLSLSAAAQREARKCGLLLADVGAAMQRFIARDQKTPAWLDDGHPTLVGSWIAAATLSRTLLGHDVSTALSTPAFCRKRWQVAHLSNKILASQQGQPETDCLQLPDSTLREVLQAAK